MYDHGMGTRRALDHLCRKRFFGTALLIVFCSFLAYSSQQSDPHSEPTHSSMGQTQAEGCRCSKETRLGPCDPAKLDEVVASDKTAWKLYLLGITHQDNRSFDSDPWRYQPVDLEGVTQSNQKFQMIGSEVYSKKKVLSIGEGVSGLLPYFRRKGADAHGLDISYGKRWRRKKKMLELAKDSSVDPSAYWCFRHFYHQGDATKNDSLYAANSFDHIISSGTLCCLAEADQTGRLLEDALISAYVGLRAGGTARFSAVHDVTPETLRPILQRLKARAKADGHPMTVNLFQLYEKSEARPFFLLTFEKGK